MNEIISENFKKLFELVLRLRADLETERKERLVSELEIIELMEKITGNGKDLSESMLKVVNNEMDKQNKNYNEIEKFEMKSNYLGNDILWKKRKSGAYSVANPDDIKSLTKQILEAQNEKLRKLDLNTYTAEDIIRENLNLIDDITN